MSNNRELSQLASLITVDDSDRSLGINTSVGIGTINPLGTLQVNSGTSAVVVSAGGSVGIGTTNPTSRLHVVGDALITGVITATNITGTASTATKLATSRSFEITGDVVASPIFFDGTDNVSLAATIQPNSVSLGTDTTGDYVQSITGTSNQITVTDGTGESSTPTLSVPNQFTAPQDVTVTRDLQVNRNLNVTDVSTLTTLEVSGVTTTQHLNVTGVSTFAGITTNTSTLFTNQLSVAGVSTFAGITTNTSTLFANQLSVSGVSTFAGITTNTSTLFANQLSVAGVSTFAGITTNTSTLFINQLSVAGVSTFAGITTNTSTLFTNQLSVSGVSTFAGITTVTGTTLFSKQLNVSGVSTISVNSSSDALRITQLGSGNALVVEDETNPDATPFVVNASGSVGIGTTNPLGRLQVGAAGTSAVVVSAGGSVGIGTTNPQTQLHIIGAVGTASTALLIDDTDLLVRGAAPQISLQETGITNNPMWDITADGGNFNVRLNNTTPYALQLTTNATNNAIDRLALTHTGSYPVLIGTATSTGTASQTLQVHSGGAYVSGGVGIGTTSTVIGIGNSFYDGTKLYVVNTIDNASTEGAYSVVIDTHMNGAQTPPANDAEQAGLLVHTKSDVTSGSTANEHQAFGIYNVLRVNGDSDFVAGAYNNSILNHTSGTVTSYYGCYNNTESTATSTITNYYGTYSLAQPLTGSSGTIGDLVGIRARTNIDGGTATATDIFAVWANIDNDAATTQAVSGTCALYYGSYDVTTGLTNPYGVYIATAAANNYFAGNTLIGAATSTGTSTQRLQVTGGAYVSGSVGIGTTNPIEKLHVVITTNGTALKLNNTLGGGGSYVDLDFDTYITSQAGYANAPATIRVIDDGAFSGHISFRTKGSSIGASQTEKVRITGIGSVGIGTTNPGSALDVQGNIRIRDTTANSTFTTPGNLAIKDNASDPYISFHESTGTRNAYIQSHDTNGFFIVQEDALPLHLITEQSQPIIFETADVEEMRITGDGLVGIGTTNPGTLLHVHEVNSGTTPLVRIQNSNATAAHNAILLELFYSGDADVSGAASSAHYIRFRDQNTNPTGQISGSSATAVLYATSSDYRLKEDITPSTNGIERIMQFKPCEFTWKESQVRSEGFIAHEVQEVFPEAVVGSKDAVDEEGNMIPQMIDPAKMVVVLTAALQEAVQRIQYLESVVGIGSS